MQCSKCGFEQPPSNECKKCGVIISKYNAIQRRHTDKKNDEINSNKGYDHKRTAIGYWIFSLIFFVVGIGSLFLIKHQINQNYVPTEALVIDSRMVDKTHAGTLHGYLNLVYQYKADQKVYRYREPSYLVENGTPEYDKLLNIVESNPKNSAYPIHYNPRNPSKPIFGGIPTNEYVPPVGIGLLFTCIALGLFLLGIKMFKKPVWVYWAQVNKIREGAYEVLAADASGENLGWKLGFAIIWNLFVVLAVVIAIVEKPNLSWQLILFFLFFISGGIYLFIRLVIGNFFAGRSFKRPKLIVSQMPMKRGDVFEINYNQTVNKRLMLDSIVVSLRCYEEKEVGRGTKTRPIRKTLHSDEKKVSLGQEFAPGMEIDLKHKFMIPADAPLSTDYSVRYQLRWVIEVQVFASNSFDFHAEFPIEVAS